MLVDVCYVCYVMLCNQLLCLYKCMLLIFPRFWFVCSVQFFIDLKYFNSESFALVAFHVSGHYIGDEGIWNLSTATPYFLLFKDGNAWQNVPV